MEKIRNINALGAIAFGSAWIVGCTHPVGEEPTKETVEQPIIGGQLATGEKYRAVGALVLGFDYPGYGIIPVQSFCTGTLVGPTEVLTARHCTPTIASAPDDGLGAYFAVGDDPYWPDELVPITGFVTAPPSMGTFQGLLLDGGRDIAVAYLDASPADVVPAQIGEFDRSMLGSRFELAGYGYNAEDYGLRHAGLSTARSLEGHWYSLLFNNDHEAFLDWYYTDASTPAPNQQEANLWWSIYKLEPNYELFIGGVEGDVVGCFGDSGGPMLLGDTAEDLTIYGVGFATEASKSQVCALGNAFVPFYNKDIKNFVASAVGL